MDCCLVIKNIQETLCKYILEHKLKSLVLGVSGGIDSTLCCALAKPVCDYLGIDLIGRSIPIATNKEEEILRAQHVGAAFCTNFSESDLTAFYQDAAMYMIEDHPVDESRPGKIRRGNLKARMRMIRLYDVASKHRGMVLSTDNYTELMVGFWTLHGDVGDYGMIQGLWKTEVYELSEYLERTLRAEKETKQADALRECIDAIPTDGLGITGSDLEQLGAKTYREVDEILKTWLCIDEDCFAWDEELRWEGRTEDYVEFAKYRESLKDHPVVKRHLATAFKRAAPINISRTTMGLLP